MIESWSIFAIRDTLNKDVMANSTVILKVRFFRLSDSFFLKDLM